MPNRKSVATGCRFNLWLEVIVNGGCPSMNKRRVQYVFGLLFLSASVAHRATAANDAKHVEPTIADFAYAHESPNQRLDFWQAKSDKPTPIVVMIHGGGWINGDKNAYKAGDVRP